MNANYISFDVGLVDVSVSEDDMVKASDGLVLVPHLRFMYKMFDKKELLANYKYGLRLGLGMQNRLVGFLEHGQKDSILSQWAVQSKEQAVRGLFLRIEGCLFEKLCGNLTAQVGIFAEPQNNINSSETSSVDELTAMILNNSSKYSGVFMHHSLARKLLYDDLVSRSDAEFHLSNLFGIAVHVNDSYYWTRAHDGSKEKKEFLRSDMVVLTKFDGNKSEISFNYASPWLQDAASDNLVNFYFENTSEGMILWSISNGILVINKPENFHAIRLLET